MMRSLLRKRSSAVAVAGVLALVLAACGADDAPAPAEEPEAPAEEPAEPAEEPEEAADVDPICEEYPSQRVEFVIPYSPGGGFDTWGRLIAPYLSDELGVDVPVVNRPGAGGFVGTAEVFGSTPDGTAIVLADPGNHATAAVAGTADLPYEDMRIAARVTVDPEVIAINPNSGWTSIEDLQALDRPVLKGAGGLSASNLVSFDAMGIEFEQVLHDGSSESILSLVRGDTEVVLFPLSSMVDQIRNDEILPVVVVGQMVPEDHPNRDAVEGVPTIDEVTGESGLNAALEQHRMIFLPPDTPDCIVEILSDALGAVFSNEEFLAEVDQVGFDTAYLPWDESEEIRNVLFDVAFVAADILSVRAAD